MLAVEAALAVLNWFENLNESEMPPERLWHHHEMLELWFHRVTEQRKHPDKQIEEIPEPGRVVAGMSENALTKELVPQRR